MLDLFGPSSITILSDGADFLEEAKKHVQQAAIIVAFRKLTKGPRLIDSQLLSVAAALGDETSPGPYSLLHSGFASNTGLDSAEASPTVNMDPQFCHQADTRPLAATLVSGTRHNVLCRMLMR